MLKQKKTNLNEQKETTASRTQRKPLRAIKTPGAGWIPLKFKPTKPHPQKDPGRPRPKDESEGRPRMKGKQNV